MNISKEFLNITKDVWPMLLIFIVVLTTIRIFYIIEKGEKFVLHREFFGLLFVIYILLLFGLVTNTDVQSYGNNFIPFKEILRYDIGSKYFLWNVVGNILIFTPFGFFISKYLDSQRWNKPLIITLVTSLTIETVQVFIGRSFDVDDIILNMLGGLIGFLIYIALTAIKKHLPRFLQRDIIYNILTVLLIVIIIFYILKFYGVVI